MAVFDRAVSELVAGVWTRKGRGVSGGTVDPLTAGVPAGTVLTTRVVTGDLIIAATGNPAWVTGNGTAGSPWLIDKADIQMSTGVVRPRVANVKITNSKIHTSYFGTTDSGVVNCTNSLLPHAPDAVVLEDCDIYCDSPSYYMDGIFGHGFTARRCHIYHCQDGVGANVTIPGQTNNYGRLDTCWIEKMVFFQGAYAPLGGTYPGSNDTSNLINPGGNPQKPDGSHADCIQLQGGSGFTAVNCYLDARFDATVNGAGVTPWIRKSSNDLTTAAGNGHSVWGTTNANAACQFNNNQLNAPIDYVTITDCILAGGRFATVNWSSTNYGATGYGTFTGHIFQRNRLKLPAGYTPGVWTSGDQPQASSPGYPLNGSSSAVDLTHIANGGNVMDADGSPAPWHAGGTTVVRYG